jgi:hypothetical protein
VLPKDETKERKWALNMKLAVSGNTAEESIEKVRKRYPEAVIYTLSHGGLFFSGE